MRYVEVVLNYLLGLFAAVFIVAFLNVYFRFMGINLIVLGGSFLGLIITVIAKVFVSQRSKEERKQSLFE